MQAIGHAADRRGGDGVPEDVVSPADGSGGFYEDLAGDQSKIPALPRTQQETMWPEAHRLMKEVCRAVDDLERFQAAPFPPSGTARGMRAADPFWPSIEPLDEARPARRCTDANSVALVPLLAPGIAIHMVASQLPEASLVPVGELKPVHPFGGFPEVEMRDEQARGPAVVGR